MTQCQEHHQLQRRFQISEIFAGNKYIPFQNNNQYHYCYSFPISAPDNLLFNLKYSAFNFSRVFCIASLDVNIIFNTMYESRSSRASSNSFLALLRIISFLLPHHSYHVCPSLFFQSNSFANFSTSLQSLSDSLFCVTLTVAPSRRFVIGLSRISFNILFLILKYFMAEEIPPPPVGDHSLADPLTLVEPQSDPQSLAAEMQQTQHADLIQEAEPSPRAIQSEVSSQAPQQIASPTADLQHSTQDADLQKTKQVTAHDINYQSQSDAPQIPDSAETFVLGKPEDNAKIEQEPNQIQFEVDQQLSALDYDAAAKQPEDEFNEGEIVAEDSEARVVPQNFEQQQSQARVPPATTEDSFEEGEIIEVQEEASEVQAKVGQGHDEEDEFEEGEVIKDIPDESNQEVSQPKFAQHSLEEEDEFAEGEIMENHEPTPPAQRRECAPQRIDPEIYHFTGQTNEGLQSLFEQLNQSYGLPKLSHQVVQAKQREYLRLIQPRAEIQMDSLELIKEDSQIDIKMKQALLEQFRNYYTIWENFTPYREYLDELGVRREPPNWENMYCESPDLKLEMSQSDGSSVKSSRKTQVQEFFVTRVEEQPQEQNILDLIPDYAYLLENVIQIKE